MDGKNSFRERLKQGKIGEGYIANWLRRQGYHVLPVYEKEIGEGKGPVLYQAVGLPLIAPDALIFKENEIRWVEAKTKSAFTWHRITKRWVTGIDLHHYEQYIGVAALTSWPVYLLFLHLAGRQAKDSPPDCPTGLFGGKLEYLQVNENHRHENWGRGGMVYWSKDKLEKYAELDEVMISLAGF